jgi:hypothetical protein
MIRNHISNIKGQSSARDSYQAESVEGSCMQA